MGLPLPWEPLSNAFAALPLFRGKRDTELPLYEYECEKGHRFELIRKFSDPPVTRCIKCKAKVRKLLSSPAIAFKGSGWYVTDYGKGSSPPKRSSGESGSDSGSSSKTKSESDSSASEKKSKKKS